VSPGFFETLGTPVVLGRSFTEGDTDATRTVAVVNEAFVKRFFKNQNPIGQHFGVGKIKYASKFEIAGVVRDIRYMTYDYKNPVGPMFWLSETQTVKLDEPEYQVGEAYSHFLYNIVVWAPGNPPGMEEKVRKALAEADPDLVVYGVDPYSKILANDFQRENMIATLTSLFGGLGLLLAAIGLYGVMSYSVEQRTSEIGVRMALGADRRRVLAMVLRNGLMQVGIGLAIGIPAAILAGHFMSDQLFGVRPWDPVMLSMATVSLGIAGILACSIPARRAATVEPMVALRNE
jgi:predicted permease